MDAPASKRRWSGPLILLIFGSALAVMTAAAAGGLWLEIERRDGSWVSSAARPALDLIGVSLSEPSGEPVAWWLVAAFIVSLALAGLGLLLVTIATVWGMAVGWTNTQAGTRLRGGLARGSDLSRQGIAQSRPHAEKALQTSSRLSRQGLALSRRGIDSSKPVARKLLGRARRRQDPPQLPPGDS